MKIKGTREWATHNYNCILGCSNRCTYCYAKMMAVRFKRCTPEEWKIEKPNTNARPRKFNGRVMFPTSHDLHLDSINLWYPHLRKLLLLGNDLLIVSKPEHDAISFICDYCREFKDQIEFRFTIGTNDDATRQFWEPGAPSIEERLRGLEYAYNTGYKTSVSMEPLLMFDPTEFIRGFEKYVTGEIWIGAMNHLSKIKFDGIDPVIYDYWVERQEKINDKGNMQHIYEKLKDNPKIRWKDSVQDMLGIDAMGKVKG